MTRMRRRAAIAIELARVLIALPAVEVGRRTRGPKPLLKRLRRKGARAPERHPAARARLRSAIAWADARCPGGANCYRRALLEIALDRGAAGEPFHMGFKLHGGPVVGHAWIGGEDVTPESYDVEVAL